MSESKNHHFIPQWRMKLWADSKGYVIVADRRSPPDVRGYKPHVRNINSQNYLYSLRGPNGENDDRLEKEIYGPLDYSAEILTSKIIDIFDAGASPNLTFESRKEFWNFYFYNAMKRHPNAFDPYLEDLDIETIREQQIQKAIDSGIDPEKSRRDAGLIDVEHIIRTDSVQYARAEQNDDVLSYFSNKGMTFGVAPKGTSFILPDMAFKIQRIGGPEGHYQEIWIPIHPSYAVRLYEENGQCKSLLLEKHQVRKLNEMWYSQAKTIISTSERQLQSLVKRHEGKKLLF